MTPDETNPEASPTLTAVRTDRARLLQLRWLSVVVMVAMAVVAFPLLAPAHPVQPLLGVTLVLAAVNLALQARPARNLAGWNGAFTQLTIDLLAWGAFLYFGGGVTNPAISLLLPVVAVGASILSARQAGALAAMAVAVYTLLWEFHHPVRLPARTVTDAARSGKPPVRKWAAGPIRLRPRLRCAASRR